MLFNKLIITLVDNKLTITKFKSLLFGFAQSMTINKDGPNLIMYACQSFSELY